MKAVPTAVETCFGFNHDHRVFTYILYKLRTYVLRLCGSLGILNLIGTPDYIDLT